MRRSFALLSLALVASACTKATPDNKRPLGEMSATGAPAAPATDAAAGNISGTVQEQLHAAPYIYIRIKTAKGDVWAAVPEGKIENGQQVTLYNPLLMPKFESKTLKRTFDEVYFGNLEGPAAPPPAAGANVPQGPVGTPPVVDAKVGKVEKATGADARTIAELHAQKAALANKTVTIRGVVVKYNANVMGKNWLHLQDGSGDAKAGTNDITVTSMDGAVLNSTVTITGTVRTNKDFGAGYSYAVIVEDAKIVKK